MQNLNQSLLIIKKKKAAYQAQKPLINKGAIRNKGKILPAKYYLEHARELFSFIENNCQHLLNREHKSYLQRIHTLSEDAQCLLVRCLARKPKFVKIASFNYPEISDIPGAFSELKQENYLSHGQAEDWQELLHQLTKPELIDALKAAKHDSIIENSHFKINNSSTKLNLVLAAKTLLNGQEEQLTLLFKQFSVRRKDSVFNYLLFLFFGDLQNRFQQFAMRDLGVKRTQNADKTMARFITQDEAMSAFEYQKYRHNFMQQPKELAQETVDFLLTSNAIGQHAENNRDKLLLSVGNHIQKDNPKLAMDFWQASSEPNALEKWVRFAHKNTNKDDLKLRLEQLQKENLNPNSQIFVEDFYQRKYHGKATSIYTDMLRENPNTLGLDEAYMNTVEDGVINFYRQRSVSAYFTENKFWKTLFFLSMWEILYDSNQTHYSEFDQLPAPLKDKHFYDNNRHEIEKCLELFESPERATAHLTRLATTHYGKENGGFRWSPNLLDSIRVALHTHTSIGDFAKLIRTMAQNFKYTMDGYPDLMIIENGLLRFEEIKAPGDVLRPNQLVSINRLRDAGFNVELVQTEWRVNPEQCYAVVDIETTGGSKSGNSITEIAVIVVRNQEVISEWSTLVNPQRHIPAHITRLTGISNSMVADAPLFTEIANELKAQLNGCIFVAHNVGFDYGFIKSAFEELGQTFRMPKFCTVSNSRKRFPGLRSYSLGALAEYFNIDLLGHHRALNDAKATAHLLCLIQNTRKA